MKQDKKSIENNIRTVSLWWRCITAPQMTRAAKCQKKGAMLPAMHPGMLQDHISFLNKEVRSAKTGLVLDGAKAQNRMDVLDSFDKKFSAMLTALIPTESEDTALRFNPDGQGLTFWLDNPDIQKSDFLEVQFYPSKSAPWPVHSYVRVVGLKVDKSTGLTRVSCHFEKHKGPLLLPKQNKASKEVKVDELVKQKLTKATPELKAPKKIKKVKSKLENAEVSTIKHQTVENVTTKHDVQRAKVENKIDATPKKDLNLASSAKKAVAKPKEIIKPKEGTNSARKDFRINDRIPFVWSVVSEETFKKECMAHFESNHEFDLRTRIKQQQILLKEFPHYFKEMQKTRSKARKYLVWIHDKLSWMFLRAGNENEEEYYQGITALFLDITKLISKPLAQDVRQIVQICSQFKAQIENQILRDQADPVIDKAKLETAKEDLVTINKANNKIIAELEKTSPKLSAKLNQFKELVDDIDLTMMDKPAGVSDDGKDLYTVNLSLTGLAFRTYRKNIKKGDLLEMRIFLSTGGERFEPVNCFGRVIFVQGPKDNKLKIATHIDPMPQSFKQKINIHITRRQREKLS
ncbi:MAG: PilZ domain-containing protein, partial [Magnetococcales bacterium]|nr:PilZ domain-containing protein [Magnetococcales bacterium]